MDNLKNIIDNFKKTLNNLKQKNKFLNFILSGKNIAIIILSFLLLCCTIAYSDSDSYKYYSQLESSKTQISELNIKNDTLSKELENSKKQLKNFENSEKQIKTLQDANTLLINEKKQLEEEKSNFETENQKLHTQIEELQASLSKETPSNPSNDNSSPSLQASSSVDSQSSYSNNNSEMVWVGNTGTKYHIQSCRTLKGKGHQITLQQALSEGRQACKVCH